MEKSVWCFLPNEFENFHCPLFFCVVGGIQHKDLSHFLLGKKIQLLTNPLHGKIGHGLFILGLVAIGTFKGATTSQLPQSTILVFSRLQNTGQIRGRKVFLIGTGRKNLSWRKMCIGIRSTSHRSILL